MYNGLSSCFVIEKGKNYFLIYIYSLMYHFYALHINKTKLFIKSNRGVIRFILIEHIQTPCLL